MKYPTTPDGRYFVVRGRLWRCSNPSLDPGERQLAVEALMSARRSLRNASNSDEIAEARSQVDAAKRLLGERGPVWWTDGAPDVNRKMARNTTYADWFSGVEFSKREVLE